MKKQLLFYILLIGMISCVDRIEFNPPDPGLYPVVIDGFISDQPGPYEVRITKAFDIQSKLSLKQPVNVKSVEISDDHGNSETLVQVQDGVYQTHPSGIRGVVGHYYKVRVALFDGRIYESMPDPILPAGSLEKVYHEFVQTEIDGAPAYGFDVFFDSNAAGQETFQFLWKFVGTYQVDTTPESHTIACGESQCANPLPCSAYRLALDGKLEYVKPCQCCSCWVDMYNEIPIVSDDQLVLNGRFSKVPAAHIPLTAWIFQNKIHVEVQQLSLSPNAFTFWKAVKAQKEATTSLFQPLSGRIVGNLRQVSGPAGIAEGIFFASAVSKRSIYITPGDVPNQGLVPTASLPFNDTCLKFANSTINKPDYWQ